MLWLTQGYAEISEYEDSAITDYILKFLHIKVERWPSLEEGFG
jgi:hypothetical protein